jgi:hypothetical protein
MHIRKVPAYRLDGPRMRSTDRADSRDRERAPEIKSPTSAEVGRDLPNDVQQDQRENDEAADDKP